MTNVSKIIYEVAKGIDEAAVRVYNSEKLEERSSDFKEGFAFALAVILTYMTMILEKLEHPMEEHLDS